MNINKKVTYAIFIAFIVVCGFIYTIFDYSNDNESTVNNIKFTNDESKENQENSDEKGLITVYICGAVMNEGVYTLENGARVYEALEMAGGVKPEAAQAIVNLARYIIDEEMIYFPTKKEVESGKYSIEGMNLLININYATKDKLMTLPGIGEAKADTIVKYRQNNGLFENIEDIMKVDGIKEALYNKIKDLITI